MEAQAAGPQGDVPLIISRQKRTSYLVLEDMRKEQYVKEHEQELFCKATEYGDMEARKALQSKTTFQSTGVSDGSREFLNP